MSSDERWWLLAFFMGTFCILFIAWMVHESGREQKEQPQPVNEKQTSGWGVFWFVILFFPCMWIVGVVLNALMAAFGLNK